MEEIKLKMAKYIDKESFEEIVYDGMYHADYLNALSEFDKKAVDAEPVVHGHWKHVGNDEDENVLMCSACGKEFVLDYPEEEYDMNYCLHCGAKMNEKGCDE